MSITIFCFPSTPTFIFALSLSSYESPSLIGLPRSLRITHDLNTKKKSSSTTITIPVVRPTPPLTAPITPSGQPPSRWFDQPPSHGAHHAVRPTIPSGSANPLPTAPRPTFSRSVRSALPLSSYNSLSLIGLPRSPRITHDLNTKKKLKCQGLMYLYLATTRYLS
jgi:hypothetical protein